MRPFIIGGGALLTLWWYLSIPDVLFDVPYSTVTESSDGRLLGARIADDGQWRFPEGDSIPFRFAKCIVAFEDERFYHHPGVDVVAIGRAMRQNLTSGEIVSGASTLSMQVIRLSRNNPSRSYWEKITEMLRATRLEAEFSKDEILQLYAAHAPFGGNVVGLEAASWRYFNRPSYQLSWSEMASLAVLPNAPSVIRPGRNRISYLNKRNRLLTALLESGDIDSITYKLGIKEDLPLEPHALPDLAHHLTERQNREQRGTRFSSDLNYDWQSLIQHEVDLHARRWKRNQVNNAAALVMDVETGRVVAYVGNTNNDEADSHEIDMLNAPRSTGSILKPFLYSMAMERGMLTDRSLIADIPTRFGDFTPTNFDKEFRGIVSVERALQLSLNIPAARVLRDLDVPVFQQRLYEVGMHDLGENNLNYGLSLILGGAEVRPLQVARSYRRWILAMQMIPDTTSCDIWGSPIYREATSRIDPASVYSTLRIMEGLERPSEWKQYGVADRHRIAWKTGTSYGFRDAWAVGTDGRWIVVAWTGNANGEGRPGVIGVETSAPLLFKIFSRLPKGEFFEEPLDEQKEVIICAQSGYRAQQYCEVVDTAYLGMNGVKACEYCELIHLNERGERVDFNCSSQSIKDTGWMFLPAGMTWFGLRAGYDYQPPPDFSPDCYMSEGDALAWVYPEKNNEVVRRTRDVDGQLGAVVLEAGHRSPTATLFWYVDEVYLGSTEHEHRFEAFLNPGIHYLTIVDDDGNRKTTSIRVMEAE